MKKSRKPEPAPDTDESRKKALQFKKRKQHNREPKINFKNIRSMEDLEDYEDEYNFWKTTNTRLF